MVKVSAAIIEEGGRFLVCRRGPGGNCAHLWEFPGGKLEEGEGAFEAAARECFEELGIDIVPIEVVSEYSFSYPDRDIYFYFIKAYRSNGEISLNVHEDARWLYPDEMAVEKFCPADREIIRKLKVEYKNKYTQSL